MPRTRTTWAALAGLAILAGLLVTRFVPRMRKDTELVDLTLPSSIQASEETAIYARSSGYVRERYVDVGDRVAAGKVLAQIDTPELDQELVQARATLQQARASLDQARANETFAGATADRFTRLEASVEAARPRPLNRPR